jgi:hypothetical protein
VNQERIQRPHRSARDALVTKPSRYLHSTIRQGNQVTGDKQASQNRATCTHGSRAGHAGDERQASETCGFARHKWQHTCHFTHFQKTHTSTGLAHTPMRYATTETGTATDQAALAMPICTQRGTRGAPTVCQGRRCSAGTHTSRVNSLFPAGGRRAGTLLFSIVRLGLTSSIPNGLRKPGSH